MAHYKAKERGYAGRIIEEGEVFEFDGPKGSWMTPCDAQGNPVEKEDEEQKEMTVPQIKAALDSLGVSYNPRAPKPVLQALLLEAQGGEQKKEPEEDQDGLE